MEMTPEGLDLICRFEGFRGEAYRCPAGIWTIGYGHTSQAGPPIVGPGLTMSEAEARRVLLVDVGIFAAGVGSLLTRTLNDAQFSALVSFAFNVGLGNFKSSSVLRAVNTGDFAAVPRRLQLWVKGGGKVLPGLVKRRAAEAAMFVADEKAAGEQDGHTPAPVEGKSPGRSSTIAAAILATLASLLSIPLQLVWSGSGSLMMALTAVTIAAAFWIVIERRRKSKEDGI